MHSGDTTLSPACLMGILLMSGIGFLSGFLGPGRYAFRSVNAVLAARYLATRKETSLPALPRSIFLALLFAFPTFVRECPGYLSQHLLFSCSFFAGGFSVAIWLAAASVFQRITDQERQARIEQFLSDAAAPVPARVEGMDVPPAWLAAWNWINIANFLLLVVEFSISVMRAQKGL